MVDKKNLLYPWMSQFTINAHRCSRSRQFNSYLREQLVQGEDLASKISSAFSWHDSPQGVSYWAYLENSHDD